MKSLTPKTVAQKLVKIVKQVYRDDHARFVYVAGQYLYSVSTKGAEALRKSLKRKIESALRGVLLVDAESAASKLISVTNVGEVSLAGIPVDFGPALHPETLRRRWKKRLVSLLSSEEKVKERS